jgi:hypothetical protein
MYVASDFHKNPASDLVTYVCWLSYDRPVALIKSVFHGLRPAFAQPISSLHLHLLLRVMEAVSCAGTSNANEMYDVTKLNFVSNH